MWGGGGGGGGVNTAVNENNHRPVDITNTKPVVVTCFYKPMEMKITSVLSDHN